MMSPEDFERMRQQWRAFETRLVETIRLRCFYCHRDLSDEAAFFDARIEAAACAGHLR